tara:strand:+ start:1036 stop:1662 length:627 start_codon:yes stop_codon:yes gene_type:complete
MIFNFFSFVYSFNLCIVGSKSGLGSELVYQALQNNKNILALSKNNDKVLIPYRGGGLDFKSTNKYIENKNLQTDSYDNFNKYKFDNIIFTLGGKPFVDDYSAIVTEDILNKQSNHLKNIVLISAFGAGNTLENANLGIKIMNNLYLKSVYKSKNKQETLINEYKKNNNYVNIFILRPKVLSYGKTISIYNAKSREQLAKEILHTIENS